MAEARLAGRVRQRHRLRRDRGHTRLFCPAPDESAVRRAGPGVWFCSASQWGSGGALESPGGNWALGILRSKSPHAIPFAVSNETAVEGTQACLGTRLPYSFSLQRA